MKKFFGMVITCMMALGLVSCSAADDDLTGDTTTCGNTVASKSNFSLLSYSQTTGAEVNETSNINGENNEKLVCKVLSGGQLQLTHKNVIFDEGTNIKFDSLSWLATRLSSPRQAITASLVSMVISHLLRRLE